jgi:hypothetical protein
VTSPSRSRLGAALAVVVTAVVSQLVLVTASQAAPECGVSGRFTAARSDWTRITPPAFPTGVPAVAAVGASLLEPDQLFVSNGVAVMRSVDGGCTWASSFTVPDAPSAAFPFSSRTAAVTSIVGTVTDRVYLVLSDVSQPRVLASADAGKTWHTADSGLLPAVPTGGDATLVAANSPGRLYLLVPGAATGAVTGATSGGDLLYASSDDGASWAPTSPAAGTVRAGTSTQPLPAFRDIAVEPNDPASLWAATADGLYRSADAGATWNNLGVGGSNPLGLVTVGATEGGRTRIVAFESDAPVAYLSLDDGASWNAVDLPAVAEAVAGGETAADVSVATRSGVYQLVPDGPAWHAIWTGQSGFNELAGSRRGPRLYACVCDADVKSAIYRRDPGRGTPSDDSHDAAGTAESNPEKTNQPCMPNAPRAPMPRDWGSPALTPADGTVRLPVGQRKTVHYTLALPPRPLEVYFLVGTGPKSEFSHCPVKYGALATVAALSKVHDVRAGLGGVGDYPGQNSVPGLDPLLNPGQPERNYVYLRERPVGLLDQTFYNRVAAQQSWWGSGNPQSDRAFLAGLLQTATGVGQVVPPPLSYRIRGGQQANFSRHGFKVVMAVAGNYFNTPEREVTYAGPTFAKTISELKARGITQVGVWVNNRLNKEQYSSEYDGAADLARVAAATSAVLHTKLDCDGDGFVDRKPGQPMVCSYLAPPDGDFESRDPTLGVEMTNLLATLRDPEQVRVSATAGQGNVASITPSARSIDYLVANRLTYDVTYACAAGQVNTSRVVQLAATVLGEEAAQARTTLLCTKPVPPPPAAQAVVVPPPPPVPPAPNPYTNPNPNPAPNPGPQPQAQPQGQAQAQGQPVSQAVPVPQRQQQVQLAFQHAENTALQDQPMSALRPTRANSLHGAQRLALLGGFCLLALSTRLQSVRALARRTEPA